MNKKYKPGDTFVLNEQITVFFENAIDYVKVKKNTVAVLIKDNDELYGITLLFCGFGLASGWARSSLKDGGPFKKLE